VTLDPFAPWRDHDSRTCEACSRSGKLEQFDLTAKQAELATIPNEDWNWPNQASLSRLGWEKMDSKMLRRFEAKIDQQMIDWHTPCWLWTGGTHDKGYGRFWLGLVDNQRIWAYAHRIAFEHWIGMPPDGNIVDHNCNHKLCCNPTHLWPETTVNNLRLADQRRPWKRRNQYSQE
jgi:hypothetical protein